MGAGKIPWWARPWPSVWWRDIVGIWVPLLIVGGALSLQISATERSLKHQFTELHAELDGRFDRLEAGFEVMNERLIRVEALLEAHIADDARHLPVVSADPASSE